MPGAAGAGVDQPRPPRAAPSGRTEAREAWDPLVRLTHWTVAALVLLNAAVLEEDGAAHAWAGYAVAALVALRLFWGLIGPRTARLSSFPPDPVGALRHLAALASGRAKAHLSHNPLGALMVWNLWATLGVLCATGVMMGTVAFFGADWVEELHEAAFGWLMASVFVHVAGVLFESWRSGVPLVRAMVDGRKRFPVGTEVE